MLDLFTPRLPLERCHPNFLAYLARPASHHQILLDWSDKFIDRDGKFVTEFQTTFNSSFWELYVFACLKHMGFEVDFSFASPDFVVLREGRPAFCVEATIASDAASRLPEWKRNWRTAKGVDQQAIVDDATLRFANAVTAKYSKYLRTYATLSGIGSLPFILAVSPYDQPFFFLEGLHPPLRVLYGVDTTDKGLDRSKPKAMVSIAKRDGVSVPLGYFAGSSMPHISAVLFSNVATAGKVAALSTEDPSLESFFSVVRMDGTGETVADERIPKSQYKEDLLDGLHVFHNPKAHYHFPRECFEFPGISQWGFDVRSGVPFRVGSPTILLQRMAVGRYIRD